MTIYLIVQGVGSYSDRYTQPMRYYKDKARAETMMAALEAISQDYEQNIGTVEAAIRKAVIKETDVRYAALGYDDADASADWTLYEVREGSFDFD